MRMNYFLVYVSCSRTAREVSEKKKKTAARPCPHSVPWLGRRKGLDSRGKIEEQGSLSKVVGCYRKILHAVTLTDVKFNTTLRLFIKNTICKG